MNYYNLLNLAFEIEADFLWNIISQIKHFEADVLWKVSLKFLNSGIILKTFTHVRFKDFSGPVRIFLQFSSTKKRTGPLADSHEIKGFL